MGLRLGRFACVAAALLAAVMMAPAFTRNLWIARLAVSELSMILVTPLALLGLMALGRTSAHWIHRGFALIALLVSLLPLAAALPAYRGHGRGLALSEYFTWGPTRAPVERKVDLSVEPSLPGLLLDFYRGHGAGPRPLLVIVHGGSFSGGDKGENRTVSELFANAGYSVADVQYRLAPAVRFPVAVQDVKCLAGRLRENAAVFGIDPDRVAYLGRSAGGAIAIVAAYSAGDPTIPPSCNVPDRPVAAMISVYGPLDLEWGWRYRPFPDPIVGYKVLERYIGGTPEETNGEYRRASATSRVSGSIPPTLLIHGTRDSLVSPYHMQLLTEEFARKGLPPPRRLLVPFAEHGFDYRAGGFGEQLARAEILDFLARSLRVGVNSPPGPGRPVQPGN